VAQIADVLDPARIKIRDESLKIMGNAMRADAQTKIQYASKYARIANAWKKWQGEVLGLKSSNAVQKKKEYEKQFTEIVNNNADLKSDYGALLPQFEKLYAEIEPYAKAREYYQEIVARNMDLINLVNGITAWVDTYYKNGEAEFLKQKPNWDKRFQAFFKDYNGEVDKAIFASLIKMYAEDLPADYLPAYLQELLQNSDDSYNGIANRLYHESVFNDQNALVLHVNFAPKMVVEKFESDPFFKLVKSFKEVYANKISPKYDALRAQIDDLQRQYMKAQMEAFTNKIFYPDANSTLRVTYGKVEGYDPRDGVTYKAQTYLEGVVEKYKPGDYEFDVPKRLIELYEKKDYGKYGENGKLPVAFIGSNHTTGGNSGSPAIDAYGNLIGLNFDRVWEGTMSDLNYDRRICRNIMVDIRYVLFIIDKFAGAKHLLDEMKLVYP
jgi:hypothetical protein